MRQLRETYGALAVFCYDDRGGRYVALKWRPAAFLPGPLRAAHSQHRILLERDVVPEERTASAATGARAKELVSAAWALPNVPQILCEMRELGAGLIRKVVLPRWKRSGR